MFNRQLAIRRHAPTVVIVDATAKSFTTYSKGVLYDERWYEHLLLKTSSIIQTYYLYDNIPYKVSLRN